MEKKSPTPMTPFDEWTVPKELHILKLLLPYTPASSQQALGILVKVIELQHTFQYFQQQKNVLHSQEFSAGFSSPLDMLEEIAPYLPPEQAEMLGTFRNMMNIMDMVQMMQEFSAGANQELYESGGPETDASSENSSQYNADRREPQKTSGSFGGGFDPMQLVMGMLSPEQQEMFEMYQTMFSQPEEPAAAGSPSENAAPSGFGTFSQTSPEVRIQEDQQQESVVNDFTVQEDGQRESGLNDFTVREDGQQEPDLDGFSLRDTDLSETGSYYDMQKYAEKNGDRL